MGLAALIAPVAVLFAAGGDVHPVAPSADVDPVVEDVKPCCLEIVAVAPIAYSPAPSGAQLTKTSAPSQETPASRWRVIDVPRLCHKRGTSMTRHPMPASPDWERTS